MKKKIFIILIIAVVLMVGNMIGIQAVDEYTYVSDLDKTLFTVENPPYDGYQIGFDANSSGNTLKVNGVEYLKGLFMHANDDSRVEVKTNIDISGLGYDGFSAYVGVDDNFGPTGPGSVQFKLYGDGELLDESPILLAGQSAHLISADISTVSVLTLAVNNGADGYSADWSVWGDAKFSKNTDVPSPTPSDVPTPTPSPTPYQWASGDTLYLSDLPRGLITTPNTPPYEGCVPHFDENERAIKMAVNGITFDKGIWYHASETYDNSVILFDISNYDFTSFTVNVGIDDYINGIGTCEFIIYADGELVAQSPVISQGQDNYKMQVNVTGVKELKLVQTNGNDGYSFDWGVWGNPLLGYDVIEKTNNPKTGDLPLASFIIMSLMVCGVVTKKRLKIKYLLCE